MRAQGYAAVGIHPHSGVLTESEFERYRNSQRVEKLYQYISGLGEALASVAALLLPGSPLVG